jgi:hypothetical protein
MSIAKRSVGGGITSTADVLAVLLYAPDNVQDAAPIRGITRLQKLMFLLWKEGRFCEHAADLFDFRPDAYGPCMDELYDSLEFFAEVDMLKVCEVPCGNDFEDAEEAAFLKEFGFNLAPSGVRRDFVLSSSGLEVGKQMFDLLEERERERLILIKRKYNNLPFWDLLRYVFKKYPTFAEKSVICI